MPYTFAELLFHLPAGHVSTVATSSPQVNNECTALMQELAHKLGLAAANFVQILAPARIVLSGPVINLGLPFLDLFEQSLRRYQLPWLPPIPAVYGGDAVLAAAQGTALLVFQRSWQS